LGCAYSPHSLKIVFTTNLFKKELPHAISLGELLIDLLTHRIILILCVALEFNPELARLLVVPHMIYHRRGYLHLWLLSFQQGSKLTVRRVPSGSVKEANGASGPFIMLPCPLQPPQHRYQRRLTGLSSGQGIEDKGHIVVQDVGIIFAVWVLCPLHALPPSKPLL
jgi:hypothetical protein